MSGLATTFTSHLDACGRLLVERFTWLNFWTAALLAGALLLDRLLARRMRAALRIGLYAPVGLRVLLPPDWSLEFAAGTDPAALVAPLLEVGLRPLREASAAPAWYALAALLYVAVALLLAARICVARLRLARALAGARPIAGIGRELGARVVEHAELGPMAVGLWRPRIVLPSELLAHGREHARACVLRHERAHLERRDAWLSAALQLLSVVAWPVAPLWFAASRVRQLMELACDEAALAHADARERHRYGHALLDLAEQRWLGLAELDASALHFGSTLRSRIEAIAFQRHWPLALQASTLALTAGALFVACGAATPTSKTEAAAAGEYGYEFDVDTSEDAVRAPPLAKLAATEPDGHLRPEAIQSHVRVHFAAIQACYAAAHARNPQLAGKVVVRSVIGEDGVTRDAADAGSTLADHAAIGCVVDVFRGLRYERSFKGNVVVVYPIQFTA